MKTKHSHVHAVLGCLALFAALQACGDDGDDNEKPPVVKPTGGTGNAGGDDSGGTDQGGTGATGNTGNTGNTDTGGTGQGGTSTEPVAGSGGAQGGGGPTCPLPERGEDDCYNCPVDGELEQWLNRCVEGECIPFDNDRVTLLNADGSRPDLP